jgi:DNA-binding MarR family transcriptional regulator
MTRGKRTTAFALAGAVALASGAYALGSQAGDGSAAAAKTTNAPGYGPPPGARGHEGPGEHLDALADRLGVKPADLRAALEDIAKAHRADFAQKLADALGIDRAKVDAAFAKLRANGPDHAAGHDRRHDFAQDLADALNLSVDKVQAALDKQRDHRGDPAALAKELGVSAAQLRQAFAKVFRDHRPGGPGRPPGPREDALAKALGVTPAKLRAAFDKLRSELGKERDAFAQELADRLNIDVAKVKAALPDGLGRHHP